MRLALIYNRGQRTGLGERCQKVLETYPQLDVSQFDLREIRKVKGGFDLYFRIDDGDYTEDIPSGLKPSAWWVADTHLPKAYRKIVRKINNYDFVFCAQKDGAEKLSQKRGRKVHWIPWATDSIPEGFLPLAEEEKKWDICFIGTSGKYTLRRVVLEILKLNYKNLFIGMVPYTQLFDYYSRARIVVNYPINNDINARIFEAMGAASLLVTYRIVDNGFTDLFEEGKHLVVFDDILKEMKEKIDYYLESTDERRKIAEEGFRYVQNNHTYRHRLTQMFKIMGYRLDEN